MLTGLIASLLITLLWIIACIFLMHLHPAQQRFGIMVKSFCGSLPLLCFFLFFLQHQSSLVEKLNGHEARALAFVISILLQILFFFFFVECFYHIERSVTLRLLIEIRNATSPMTVTTLMKDYSVDDMIKRRLEDMLKNKWIYCEGNHWKLSSKGLWLARSMLFSCWLFQSKPQNERL